MSLGRKNGLMWRQQQQVLGSSITQAKPAEKIGIPQFFLIVFFFRVRKRYAPNVFAAASICAIISSKSTLISELTFALDALSQCDNNSNDIFAIRLDTCFKMMYHVGYIWGTILLYQVSFVIWAKRSAADMARGASTWNPQSSLFVSCKLPEVFLKRLDSI